MSEGKKGRLSQHLQSDSLGRFQKRILVQLLTITQLLLLLLHCSHCSSVRMCGGRTTAGWFGVGVGGRGRWFVGQFLSSDGVDSVCWCGHEGLEVEGRAGRRSCHHWKRWRYIHEGGE